MKENMLYPDEIRAIELKRTNALLALLCQIVIETHGSSLKYRAKLEEIMK